jgi:DNA recombination protein RmuC
MQLRRVVELAGMLEHCDFVEQQNVPTADGRLRPDLIVRLPGRKSVVVDSKAPLQAYLDAAEETDETQRGMLLDQHARQVRVHIDQLSAKNYANELADAPDFVVLFLPGEAFFSEACRRDPGLIDYAVNKGVIPASPTTLITILKAVSYGWRQERIGENAERIRDLGIELYDRLRTTAAHLDTLRRSLAKSVESYNAAVGSLESRVLPTARKLHELGAASGEEIPALEPVDMIPRAQVAPELTLGAPENPV